MRWQLGIAVLVASGCGKIAEDFVYARPITDAEAQAIDCDEMCSRYGYNFDSVNFCTIAQPVVHPYLICKYELAYKDSPVDPNNETALPFPSGLDPATRGKVDLSWCPQQACTDRKPDGHLQRVTVTECRINERPPGFTSTKFLVCSIRTKTDASAAFQ